MLSEPLFFSVFSSPSQVETFSLAQWQSLLQQAYKASAVSRLYVRLNTEQLVDYIPEPLQWHFTSAFCRAEGCRRDFNYSLSKLVQHLSSVKTDICLLKGAAYAIDESNPVGKGRQFADIDLLVDRQYLNTVEQVLLWHGWHCEKETEYDDKYYRDWMHELPPMRHSELPVGLDLHHHLVPPTSKMHFEAGIFNSLLRPTDTKGMHLLTVPGQMLHTSLHMLTNDDLSGLLKDLMDFYILSEDIDRDRHYLDLIGLATTLNIEVHVKRAIRIVAHLFSITLPAEVQQLVQPTSRLEGVVDRLYLNQISHQLLADPQTESYSTFLLWCRAHWLKMPLPLLIKHTFSKFTRYVVENKTESKS